MLKAWIQLSDYSSEDLGVVDVEKAIKVFEEYPWAAETEKYEAECDAKKDLCPPGMGFGDGDPNFHITLSNPETYYVYFQKSHKKKLLGFIPVMKWPSGEAADLTKKDVISLIRMLFEADYDGIFDYLNKR